MFFGCSIAATAAETSSGKFPDDGTGVADIADRIFVGELLLAFQDGPVYAGEWLEESRRTLILYGTTDSPPGVVAEALASAPYGFTVQWEKAAYSQRELTELASQIWQSGLDVEAVYYAYDGSGLTVSYVRGDRETGVSGVVSALPTQRFGSAPAVTWVPVEEGYVVPADTRTTDTAPFDGGSRIKHGSTGCSAGLSAERDSTGTIGMLTAWHCSDGAEDITWKVSGAGATLGETTSVKSKAWDAQFIKGSAKFTSKIFSGASDTGSKRALASAYLVLPYAVVSTVTVSGSYSGNEAGRITALTEVNYLGSAQEGKKYYQVEAAVGDSMGGNGDSGSPTVDILDNGSVIPVGLYVAGSSAQTTECHGVASSSTRKCSRIGFVTPWYRIANALNLS